MAFINFNIAEAIAYPSVNLVFSDDTTATKEVTALNYTTNLKAVTASTVISYQWQRKKDGGVWQNLISTDVNTKQDVVNTTGVYTYRCRIIDENDLSSAYSNEIVVNFTLEDLQNPVADIDVVGDLGSADEFTSVVESGSVSLTGEESQAFSGATIESYSWEIIAKPSGSLETFTPNINTCNIDNLKIGNYVIKLTVTDSNGLVGSTTFAVTVTADASPVLQIQTNNYPECVSSGVWDDGQGGTVRFKLTFKGLVIGANYESLIDQTVSSPQAGLSHGIPTNFVAQNSEMSFYYLITFTNQVDQSVQVDISVNKEGETPVTATITHLSSDTAIYANYPVCTT